MPLKCCVPGCKSNYKTEGETYVTVFKFPTDEELCKKWIKNIPRDNWVPTKYSAVCVKHFPESAISRSEKFRYSNGDWKEFTRKSPVLEPEAVPQIFPQLAVLKMTL